MNTRAMVGTMCDSTSAMRIRQLSTKSMLNFGFSIPRYMVPNHRKTMAKLSM
jgi:hypothetical protein